MNKNPGKGLEMIWNWLKDWWNAPEKCDKHDVPLFCHGYDETWDCPVCYKELFKRYNEKL